MDACTCVGLNALIVPWQLSSVRNFHISWPDVVDTQNWKMMLVLVFFFFRKNASISKLVRTLVLSKVNCMDMLCCYLVYHVSCIGAEFSLCYSKSSAGFYYDFLY